MTAHALGKAKASSRGVRPFDPLRDAGVVSRLLAEAFREDSTFPLSRSLVFREIGIFLWTLNYFPVFPTNVSGFVWIEDGRVVGNATITPDEGRLDRVYISNVAVKPGYRRRGIARQLVLTTLDEARARGAKWVLLNVRPTNPGAVNLYRDLGFEEVETNGEWTLAPHPLPPLPKNFIGRGGRGAAGGEGGEVRPLRSSDYSAVTDLVRAAAPANAHPLRPLRYGMFWIDWDDRIAEIVSDFFIGQETRRYALERNGGIAATMTLRAQRIASPHRIDILVHRDFQSRIEEELIAFGLNWLARFPVREIRASATSAQPAVIAALEKNGFRLLKGLTLMSKSI